MMTIWTLMHQQCSQRSSSPPIATPRERGVPPTCQSRQRTRYLGEDINRLIITFTDGDPRVEKYRPSTLDDVSGHQDILATINKFVEANVRTLQLIASINSDIAPATTTSTSLWTSRYWQDIYSPRVSKAHLWKQEHETDGARAQRIR